MNKKKWISSLIVLGTLVIGTIIIPTRAETVATEQPVEGGNVLLEKYCKNVYYTDSKVNTKCKEYGEVYEQVINAFVSDVKLYNENITNYNKYQAEKGGTLFLNSYVTKKKYLDYNGDKKYQGKEE